MGRLRPHPAGYVDLWGHEAALSSAPLHITSCSGRLSARLVPVRSGDVHQS